MERLNLEKFYEINNHYKELQRKANDFYKELKDLNSKLDIEEVESKCSYLETKEILNIMKYCTEDKNIVEKVQEIMNKKKELEYPEINGVQYFKEINDFDLSEDKKIELDKLLREAYSSYNKRVCLENELDSKIIQKLLDLGILEKNYILSCGCYSMNCSQVRISETELQKYISVWNKSFDEMNEDDDEYSYIEIPCFEECIDEITSIEEFKEYGNKKIEYSFKKEPDLTLELL